MYRGEPHRVSASPCGCRLRAKPKSAIFSSAPVLVVDSRRFCGFRSLCRQPAASVQSSLLDYPMCTVVLNRKLFKKHPYHACRVSSMLSGISRCGRDAYVDQISRPELAQASSKLAEQGTCRGLRDALVSTYVFGQVAPRAVFHHQVHAVSHLHSIRANRKFRTARNAALLTSLKKKPLALIRG